MAEPQTSESHWTNEDVTGQALKIGVRLVWGIYSLIVIAVIGSFGVGVFFARTDQRLQSVEGSVVRLEATFVEDFNGRLRDLESKVARGVLSRAEKDIADLEKRLRELESTK